MKGSYSVARQFSDEDQETETPKPSKEAARYIASIRNKDKKLYASLYYKFLLGDTHKPDDRKISYMAAQGVRMHLCNIMSILG